MVYMDDEGVYTKSKSGQRQITYNECYYSNLK